MDQEDLRFVIQKHQLATDIHWDFMLESGSILETYRLDKSPEDTLRNPANAVKIFDHALKFLTYQGPLSKDRGSVCIVESGKYQITHQDQGRIVLNLKGQILKGIFALTHIKDDHWRFGTLHP